MGGVSILAAPDENMDPAKQHITKPGHSGDPAEVPAFPASGPLPLTQ